MLSTNIGIITVVTDSLTDEIQNRRDICDVRLPTFCCFIDTITGNFCIYRCSIFESQSRRMRVLFSLLIPTAIKGKVAPSLRPNSLQLRISSVGLAPLFFRYEISRALLFPLRYQFLALPSYYISIRLYKICNSCVYRTIYV